MKTVITKEGWMVIEGDSHISRWVQDEGRLDHDAYWLPMVLSHIRPDDDVIDAGANIGTHTISYANKVGSRGLVVAIEHGESSVTCLQHNVDQNAKTQNKAAGVRIFNAALGQAHGRCGHVESENVGASHVIPGTTVPVITLDSLMPVFSGKPVRLIKMDIEGCETKALLGASNLITRDRPILAVEVNHGALQAHGSSRDELLDIIRRFGYDITKYPASEPWIGLQYDVICIPK